MLSKHNTHVLPTSACAHTSLAVMSLTVPGPTPSTVCRCCGNAITNRREKRKISSNAVRPLIPTLIRLLGEHYHGEKTDSEIHQIWLPTGSLDDVYICRQPCLYALQRFQKLENDIKVQHASILGRFASQYPVLDDHQGFHNQSKRSSVLGKHQRREDDTGMEVDPPAKRANIAPEQYYPTNAFCS